MSVKAIINKIAESVKDSHLLAIFDRDGTLVPINSDPNAAILDSGVLKLLLTLDSLPNIKVAILSARDLEELSHDFENNDLILGGNYGMELRVPNRELWKEPNALRARGILLKVKSELQKRLPEETQVILEDHQLTLCLHWHLVPLAHRDKVHGSMALLKKKYAQLVFKTLPTSYEIWPAVEWDKSFGLIQMTAMLETNLNKCLLLYFGDSDSDEPAFAWVNSHGGITVRVGKNEASMAQFDVGSTEEVKEILKLLIANKKKS